MGKCKGCGGDAKGTFEYCDSCYRRKPQSDDTMEFRYNIIKGKIAEMLIEELFLSLDYNVFRYGMEHTVPTITKLIRGVRGDVALAIRRMPDFIVQHPKSHKLFFVEVKFRGNGKLVDDDLNDLKDYPYKEAYIVLVSRTQIKCAQVWDLVKKEAEFHNLADQREFDFTPEAKKRIDLFCEFANKIFGRT